MQTRQVVCGLAAVLGMLAGPGPGPAQKEDYHITLYDHPDYKGKSQTFRQESKDLGKVQFNNTATSAKWHLPPGKAAVCYADKNFKRPVLVLVGDGESKDFRKDCPNAQNSITSVNFLLIEKATGYPPGIPREVVKLGE